MLMILCSPVMILDYFMRPKQILSKTFKMNDLGEATFVLGIEIHREKSLGMLGLS